jgi:hypothetical protein
MDCKSAIHLSISHCKPLDFKRSFANSSNKIQIQNASNFCLFNNKEKEKKIHYQIIT